MMWTTWRSPGRQSGAIDSATAIGPSSWSVVPEPELLAELAVQRLLERLPSLDAAAGEQPVLLARLLLPAEQHAVLPAHERRDPDARLVAHLSASTSRSRARPAPTRELVDLDRLDLGHRHDDELGDPHPRLDHERLARSVFSSATRSSPR